MSSMGRSRVEIVTAALAAVAVAATLVGPCTCLPQTTALDEHACCAPPAGYRTAATDCCPDRGEAADDSGALSPKPQVAPDLLPDAAVTPLSVVPGRAPSSAPAPAVSPPLTVRRL